MAIQKTEVIKLLEKCRRANLMEELTSGSGRITMNLEER